MHKPTLLAFLLFTTPLLAEDAPHPVITDQAVSLSKGGQEVLRYHRVKPPEHDKLPVAGGNYFHPLTTPKGLAITDVAPEDHRHHRGIFLAWVEMHGQKDGDFWGWGEPAPAKDRVILNRSAKSQGANGFVAESEWLAESAVMLRETLEVRLSDDANGRCLDLTYRFVPTADLRIARWAFSGFCIRTRKDGKLTALSPKGLVELATPSHVKPESNWPDAAWYAYALKLNDGTEAGAAVISHPKNPPTTWHNQRDLFMINPCVVATADLNVKSGQTLTLRYRVVAFDGPANPYALDYLAKEFRGQE